MTVSIVPTPKNKRLNQRDRDALHSFAKKQIEATEDHAALDAAYERAANAIHAVVIAKSPPKDMQILVKYGCATADSCIFISTGGYNYERFQYRDGDKRIALRPDSGGCHRQPILLEGEAGAAYDDFREVLKAVEQDRKKRLSDFKALIYGTPSFNSLVEVWPAAASLRDQIVGTGTALAVLSSEVVDRIKADPALLAEAA